MTDSRPKRRTRAWLGWLLAVVLVVAAVIVLVVRGIGGDSSQPSATTPSTSSSPTPTATQLPIGITFGNRLFDASQHRIQQAMADVVALHMHWIRIDMSWSDLQPTSADSYQWAPMDAIVTAARARHLSVLGLITYTPAWARASGCTTFVCPPRQPAQFARFAGSVVDRYAPRGVHTYQVWNEPNITQFWTRPNPTTYRKVLQQSVTAMRAADRSVRVVFGGLAFTSTNDGNYSPADFVRQACARAACPVDALAFDPYTFPSLPSSTAEPLNSWQVMNNPAAGAQELTAAARAVGLGSKTIWVTGFGAPTGSATGEVSGARQARILVDGLRLARSSPQVIGGFFVDTWRDTSGDSLRDHFGIEDNDGTHKPAFNALAKALK